MCDICGGDLVVLGALGNIIWATCRNCGCQQQVTDTADLGGFHWEDDQDEIAVEEEEEVF